MSNKVVLVGHCGADSSYLRMAVQRADPKARVVVANGAESLRRELAEGSPLVLVNRMLDYGYEQDEGVALIAAFKNVNPAARWMMVSNYPEAHEAAVAAGGLAGFGKREIGSPKVTEMLRSAMGKRPEQQKTPA